MRQPGARSQRRGSFLKGLGSVGSGVIGAGVLTYLFLSLAGRVLGPEGFTPVSTLWSFVFIVGPGLFLPLQQELGRVLAAQREHEGGGGGTAVRRTARLTAVVALVIVVLTVAAGPWITDTLFSGSWAMLWCFEGAIVAYAAAYLIRGVLSGRGEFGEFGQMVVLEAVTRLVVGGVLTLAGVRSAAGFGAAIAVAPLLSSVLITRFGRRLRMPAGDDVTWAEISRALGWLTIGSVFAQFVANAGPLAVQILQGPGQKAEAGRFLSALLIARVTLYLFQAVQATIVPNLAELATQGQDDAMRNAIRRITLVCGVLVVVSGVGALLLGPWVVHLLFGDGFEIGARTMCSLAASSSVYVLAAALNGASIAGGLHRLSGLTWVFGGLAFMIGILLSHDLFQRVEIGYAAGSVTAALILVVGLERHARRHDLHPEGFSQANAS